MDAYELYYTVRAKATNNEGTEIISDAYEISKDNVIGHIQQAYKINDGNGIEIINIANENNESIHLQNRINNPSANNYLDEFRKYSDIEFSIYNAKDLNDNVVSFASLVDPLAGKYYEELGKNLGTSLRLFCISDNDNGDKDNYEDEHTHSIITEKEPLDETANGHQSNRVPCIIKDIESLASGHIIINALDFYNWAKEQLKISSGNFEWYYAFANIPDNNGNEYKLRFAITEGSGEIQPKIIEWVSEPFTFAYTVVEE